FGVEGAHGGQFTFSAARIDIADGAKWAGAQHFDPSQKTSTNAVTLGDELFSGHGFTSFNIVADGGLAPAAVPAPTTPQPTSVLTVKSGSVIDTRTNVLALAADLGSRASGGTIAGFS